MKMSKAELLDRWTIRNIKEEKGVIPTNEFADEFDDAVVEIVQYNMRLQELVQVLGATNRRLWVLEDEIRESQKAIKPHDVASASYMISQLNSYRGKVKCEISKIVGEEEDRKTY